MEISGTGKSVGPSKPAPSARALDSRRLAEALRENLKKRKAQERRRLGHDADRGEKLEWNSGLDGD